MACFESVQQLRVVVGFLIFFTLAFLTFTLMSQSYSKMDATFKPDPTEYLYVKLKEIESVVHEFGAANVSNQSMKEIPPVVTVASAIADGKPSIIEGKPSIAIGLGVSCRKMTFAKPTSPTAEEVAKMPFLKEFLPSFCLTYSQDYIYRFYIGYDYNDPLLGQQESLNLFLDTYEKTFVKHCKDVPVASITMVKVNHNKKPAWAQNDAMMRSYLDHNDFYYRINDDTILQTEGWQKTFIEVLSNYDPAYIGVVGPSFKMGNTGILTYDFVHRTHVDMFGFYYPRKFEGWHADRWISDVYKPGRSTKDKRIWIQHVESLGQRYPSHLLPKNTVVGVIKDCQEVITRSVCQERGWGMLGQ